MAKRFKHVYAFEPQENVFECYKMNVAPYDNVTSFRCGLGAVWERARIGPGPVKKQRFRQHSGLGTVIRDNEKDTTLIPLDSLGLEQLDFLKIDVEGFELFVLQGAEQTLRRCKPLIIAEENNRCKFQGVEHGEMTEFLASLGAKKVADLTEENYAYAWE
jgi:FkbM family methyltransferase